MELKRLCRELERAFPLGFAKEYEPLSFIFSGVNEEAGINYRKVYERRFRDLYNGLMISGMKNVGRVFCVVFPNQGVLRDIMDRCRPGDLIFTHHCCGYDDVKGFVAIPAELVGEMKEKGVSLYSMHVPFDVNGPWSTSVQLAKALDIEQEGEFAAVMERPTGVFGRPPVDDLHILAGIVGRVTGNSEVTVITNRKDQKVSRVAVLAGGGGYASLVNDASRAECDTYLTGTAVETVDVEAAQEANRLFRKKAEELGINLIGGGHYYTEKVAVERMTEYFRNLGLESEFVPGP